MPFIGNAGQFSNIYEKNCETTTLRVIEGDAAYQAYNPDDSHYKLITNLQEITGIGNVTSNTVQFSNAITGFVTTSNIGIANSTPVHTLDIGSNVFIDDVGEKKISTTGTIHADEYTGSTVTVTDSVTVRDVIADRVFPKTNGFIQFTSNIGILNTAPTHTLDIGANVQIDEYGSNTFWTSGNVYSTHYKGSNVTVTGSTDSDVLIVNRLDAKDTDFIHATSNVGILNTAPIHTLDIGANVQIDEYGSNTFWTSGNVHANVYTGSEIQLSGVIRATDFILTGGSSANPTPELQAISEVPTSGGGVSFSSDRTLTLSNATTALDATVIQALTVNSNLVGDNVTAITVNSNLVGDNFTAITVNSHLVGDNVTAITVNSNLVGDNVTAITVNSNLVGDNVTAITVNSNLVGDNVTVVTVNSNVVGDNVTVFTVNSNLVGNNVVTTSDITGGTTFYVKQSTNKVGINKAEPTKALDVIGEIACSSDLTVSGNLIVNGTTTTIDTVTLSVKDTVIELGKDNVSGTSDLGLIMSRPDTVSNVAIFYNEDDDKLQIGYTRNGASDTDITFDTSTRLPVDIQGNLQVGTANLFVDTTTSNVGIGKSTPEYTLDVVGDINLSGDFYQGGSLFVSSLWTSETNSLYYRSNVEVGTANLFVDTVNSRIGVGTSTPEHTLDIHGSANVGALTATSVAGTTVGSHYGQIIGSNAAAFTTTSFGSTYQQMINLYDTTHGIGVQTSTQYYRSDGGFAWFKGGVHSNTTDDPGTDGALAMKLDSSYNLTASGDVTAFSDKRVKTDIMKIDDALNKVCSINGYTYRRIDTDDDKIHTGVIAQEVMEVLPEVVHGSEDTTYSVAYGNMVGLLIEAIKELKLEIDELKKLK